MKKQIRSLAYTTLLLLLNIAMNAQENAIKNKMNCSLDSIIFETFGYDLIEEKEDSKIWRDSSQLVYLIAKIYHYKYDEDNIAIKPENEDSIRVERRASVVKHTNGGLIQCDIQTINDTYIYESIIKQPKEDRGMIYIGSLFITFEHCFIILKIQAYEGGITGERESAILDMLWKQDKAISFESNPKANELRWATDPYDENYEGGRLMNLSEDKKYDQYFPNHPLTIVRKHLEILKHSIQF